MNRSPTNWPFFEGEFGFELFFAVYRRVIDIIRRLELQKTDFVLS